MHRFISRSDCLLIRSRNVCVRVCVYAIGGMGAWDAMKWCSTDHSGFYSFFNIHPKMMAWALYVYWNIIRDVKLGNNQVCLNVEHRLIISVSSVHISCGVHAWTKVVFQNYIFDWTRWLIIWLFRWKPLKSLSTDKNEAHFLNKRISILSLHLEVVASEPIWLDFSQGVAVKSNSHA